MTNPLDAELGVRAERVAWLAGELDQRGDAQAADATRRLVAEMGPDTAYRLLGFEGPAEDPPPPPDSVEALLDLAGMTVAEPEPPAHLAGEGIARPRLRDSHARKRFYG